MSTAESQTRISISEEKLRAILAEFKLELVDLLAAKASQRAFDSLASRVAELERWQAARNAANQERRRLSAMHIALAALAASLLGALATLAVIYAT